MPVQQASCAVVAKADMSALVSAMNPGMDINRSCTSRKGTNAVSIRTVSRSISALWAFDPVRKKPDHESVVVAEPTDERLGQNRNLRTHPTLG